MPHISKLDKSSLGQEELHDSKLSQAELKALAEEDLQAMNEETKNLLKGQFDALEGLKKQIAAAQENSEEKASLEANFLTAQEAIHTTLGEQFLSFHVDEEGAYYVKDPDSSEQWTFAPLDMSKEQMLAVAGGFDELLETLLGVTDKELYEYDLTVSEAKADEEALKDEVENGKDGEPEKPKAETGMFAGLKKKAGQVGEAADQAFQGVSDFFKNLNTNYMPKSLKGMFDGLKVRWSSIAPAFKSAAGGLAMSFGMTFGIDSLVTFAKNMGHKVEELNYADGKEKFLEELATITPDSLAAAAKEGTNNPQRKELQTKILNGVMTQSFYDEHTDNVLKVCGISPMDGTYKDAMNTALTGKVTNENFQSKTTQYLESTKDLALQSTGGNKEKAKLTQAAYLISQFYLGYGGSETPVVLSHYPALSTPGDTTWQGPTKNINGKTIRHCVSPELGWAAAGNQMNDYASLDDLIKTIEPKLLTSKYTTEYNEIIGLLDSTWNENQTV